MLDLDDKLNFNTFLNEEALYRFILFFLLYSISPFLVLAQLSGTYTINQSGGGNYTSLQAAAQALNSQGMSGPVTLRLANGVYNEQVEFNIPNHNENLLLTIESQSGNESDVVIRYENATDETNYQLAFHNIKAVTIRNISINTANTSKGAGILFFGECSNILIENLDHKGNRNHAAIAAAFFIDYLNPPRPIKDLTVKDSHFYECSPSISLGLLYNEGEQSTNIHISNNTFKDADGVNINSSKNVRIHGNLAYGEQYFVQPIKMMYVNGLEITQNTIYKSFNTINLMMCEGTQEEPIIIANNFISGKEDVLQLLANKHILFAHNSVFGNHGSVLVRNNGNEDSRFLNNIFYQNHTSGSLFFIHNLEQQPEVFDYNCLYSNGHYGVDATVPGMSYLDYDAYKNLTLHEIHGISVQPNFVLPGVDLHVENQALNQGVPLPEIAFDIDGELRDPTHPTMGADEMDGIIIATDLTIDTVITSGNLNGGDQLAISWSGQNLSNGNFNPPWIDRIYLSDDDVLDANDVVLQNYQITEVLPPFQSYNRQVLITLPLALSGTKYIIVKIDANANLVEDNSNNVAVSAPFEVTPPNLPNLVVTDITLPDNVFSGTTLEVNFTVKNTGQAPAVGNWTEFIWFENVIENFNLGVSTYKLVNTPVAKVNNIVGLMPGESYQGTAFFELPYIAQGYRYIRVETDGYDNVVEEVGQNDNFTGALIDSVFVNQTPLADLVVTQIQTPAEGFAGEEIEVSYTVKNVGTKTTSPVPLPYNFYMGWTWGAFSADWLDYIYLSDHGFNIDPAVYNAIHLQNGLLAPDESYVATKLVKLPKCTSGEYFVTISVDRWNHVAELAENNNAIVSDPIQVVARPAPDLVPELIAMPSGMASNSSYTLSYKIENLGADTAFATWRDRIFLSHSDTFNFDIEEMWGDTIRNVTLAPDESQNFEIHFDVPPHIYGNVYLYLWVDATNKVCEYPFDENNILTIPVQIAMSPAADLEVKFNMPPAEVIAGDELNLQAIVKNVGDDVPNNFTWIDRIFLLNEVASANDTAYIENYYHQNILPVNASYQLPDPFVIPLQTTPGFYRLGVIADLHYDVWENELKENNVLLSDVFQIKIDSTRAPDLQPVALANQEWTTGQAFDIDVNIKNTGKKIEAKTWIDQLLLTDTLGHVLAKASKAISGSLNTDAEYTTQFHLEIPPGTPENAYLVVKTDTSNHIFEYYVENNIKRFSINVNAGPAPDLSPTDLEIPEFVNAGQEMSISVLRNNFGDGAIANKNWVERILLSTDAIPDKNDIVIKSYSHLNEEMPAFFSEMHTDEIYIPLTMVGTYFVIYFMDADNHIPEGDMEGNNYVVSSHPIEITVPLPVDFNSEFININIPDGNLWSMEYQLTNTSVNDFTGKFYNTYFLSKDTELSNDDLFVGADHIASYAPYNPNITITAGETLDRMAHFLYVPVVAGDYYIIQKVDAMQNVYETDETNNVFVFGPFFIDNIPEIQPDTTYSKRFGKNPNPEFYGYVSGLHTQLDMNAWLQTGKEQGFTPKSLFPGYDPGFDPNPDKHDFKINIPDGFGMVAHMWEDQELNWASGVSDIDKPIYEMYIGEEFVPSPLHFDFRFDNPMQNEQTIIVPVAGQRMDYIKTRAPYMPPMSLTSDPLRNNYLLRAEFKEFSVFKVHPEKVGTAHNVTLRITGFDLVDDQGLDVALILGSDTTYAFETYPQNQSELIAYIDMRKKPFGNYDLLVRKKTTGAYTIWEEKVQVIADEGALLFIDINGPTATRSENDVQIEVAYGNNGYSNEYDMIAIVAVFMDDSTSNGLKVTYLGSTWPGYSASGFVSTEQNEAELIELGVFDEAIYYGIYIPIVHARSRESLHFKVNGAQPGVITIQGTLGLVQRSPYTFTGRVADAGLSNYLVMLDNALAQSDDILAALGKSGGGGCEEILDVDNMTGRLAEQTYAVAERARGASSFKDDVKKNVKTALQHDAGIKARYDAMKGLISQKKQLSLTANDETPFYSELKDIFKCLGPDAHFDNVQGESCKKIAKWSRDGVEYEVKVDMRNVNSSHCPLPQENRHIVKDYSQIENPTSKDPNEIIGPAGSGPARIVSNDELFEYTVFFENMAEAGAPAARVRIDNPLDSNLRMASFRIKAFGFADTTFNFNEVPFIQQNFELGNRYHGDLLRVVAGADMERNKAFFEFTTIDPETRMLVTGTNNGFLLPNDSTGRGQGFITYVIEPHKNLDAGTEIKNKAAIVFDGNEIIETNTWSNLIAGGELKSRVMELPKFSPQKFDVSWQNLTPVFAPEAEAYDIFVRNATEDGEWQKWLENASYFTKSFEGKIGHTYEFYSRAKSGGILEKLRDVPHATTTILDFKGEMWDGNLLVFPNPAIGNTTLAYYSSEPGINLRVEINDLTGKRIAVRNFVTPGKGVQYLDIPLHKVAPGVYVVALYRDKDRLGSTRLVTLGVNKE